MLIRAMLGFLESSIHDLLNDCMDDALNDTDAYPEPDDALDGLVDYRDLLLPKEEAVTMLGWGSSPYREIFRLLYGLLDDILSNKDALSWLNAFIVELTGLKLDDEGVSVN